MLTIWGFKLRPSDQILLQAVPILALMSHFDYAYVGRLSWPALGFSGLVALVRTPWVRASLDGIER